MAKAAELDKDLVDGLKAAKSKRAYFALVLKGSNDGALIVSKTKVPPAAIAEAKKKSGGSAALKGFCQYEDGTYVFETAKQAPATASQAVKIIAKRDAGLAVKAEFRVGTDPELLADEGGAAAEAEPKAASAPPLSGDAVIKRFHAMTADIQAALGGPNNDRVKALFAKIRDQLVAKDFAGATKNIDELAPLVKPVKSAAGPKDNGADVTKRLGGMTADIKAALAGPNKAGVQALYVSINGQIKNKDFTAAGKGLDELGLLLKHGAPVATPPPNGAELTKRLNAMTPEIKSVLTGPNKARIQPLFVAVTGQIKNQEFAAAAKSLDELERLVRSSKGDGPAPKGTGPTQKDGPELAAALQDWTTARSAAVGQLAKLVAAFKTSNHPKAETGIALIQMAITKNLTPRPATPQQVDELVRYIDTDEIFSDVETPNPFGFTVNVRKPLLDVLTELKKHVA
jgi:hypothetical protein